MSAPEEPFHTNPRSVPILANFGISLAVCGLILFGILHFRSEPLLHCPSRCRRFLLKLFIVYEAPCALIVTASTMGAKGDGDAIFWLAFAVAVEGALCTYFFLGQNRRRLFPRLGRRVLFVSMGVLLGASTVMVAYNRIDYYGPLRVTDVDLQFWRPEQHIDPTNPSYHYYYTLAQKLEWGDNWACPMNGDQWCSATVSLYYDQCKKRINCKGRPEDYLDEGKGECATILEQLQALEELIDCWLATAQKEGISPGEFSNANFTRAVAPWDDPLGPHTVARSVTCDSECSVETTVQPKLILEEASLEWLVGGVLVMVGCALLYFGYVNGQEQEAITPSARFVQVATTAVEAHDLELCETNSRSNIPVAHTTPASNSTGNVPMAHATPIV